MKIARDIIIDLALQAGVKVLVDRHFDSENHTSVQASGVALERFVELIIDKINTNPNEENSTMRDYFAAKALQGLASKEGKADCYYEARLAYKYADEMLKAMQE